MIWSVICTFSDSGHGSTGHIIPYYTILYLLDPFGYSPFDLYPLLSGRAPALQAPGIAKASRDLAAALAAVEVLWPVSSLRPFPVGELSHPGMICAMVNMFGNR